MAKNWVETPINLTANTTYEYKVQSKANVILVRNPSATNVIYLGRNPLVSSSDYDSQAAVDGYGGVIDLTQVDKVYLLASANISNVYIREIYSDDPLNFLKAFLKTQTNTNNTNVISTVGLKSSDLNLDGSKNLNVVNAAGSQADGHSATIGASTDADTAMTVIGRLKKLLTLLPAALTGGGNLKTAIQEALPAGTNNIGDVDVLSLPAVEQAGWTWAKVISAAGGDETVKATAGKIAKIVVEGAITVYPKDGTDQAWASGSQDFPNPLNCLTSIKLNFSAGGTAWILYK